MKLSLAITMAALLANLSPSGAGSAEPASRRRPRPASLRLERSTPESIPQRCGQSCRTKSAKR